MKMERSCLLRLILVQTSLVISSISEGMIVGQLSGMVAALQSNDSDVSFSKDVVSWIASATSATSIIGLGLSALVSTKYGRRKATIVLSLPVTVTWIMLYYATSPIVFITSRALAGIFGGGVLMMSYIATGEYAPLNKRSLCLYIVTSVALTFGMALGHILSILFHWRTVALISIVPTVISSILPYFWVESPSWLASKGRFEESEAAFRALHGYSESADSELNLLMYVEKSKQSKSRKDNYSCKTVLCTFLALFTKRSFWNLCFLSLATIVYRTAAGKFFFGTLAITMLQDLTGGDDVLLFTLVVDGFSLLGTCISCLIISKSKMRTLLFSAGILSNIILLALTACIYFNVEHSVYIAWIKCILLALYLVTVNSGPYPVLDGLIGEVFPLELKGYYTFLFGIIATLALFLSLKLAFDMVSVLGYHGLFLLNTILVIGALIYMWYYLPETKGRTLQEIEIFFETNSFERVDKIKNEKVTIELVNLKTEEKNNTRLLLP